MPFDTVAYHAGAAAKNGLTSLVVNTGETMYKYSGGDLYVPRAGRVVMASAVTAGIANLDEWRFKRALDSNWCHTRVFARDQTGAVDRHNIMWLNYPFFDGDILRAEADNGNNSQIDAVYLWLEYGNSPPLSISPSALPSGAYWVNGVGGTTVAANSLTKAAMTWSSTFDFGRMYRVLGMVAYSATGYLARLYYKSSSPAAGFRPAVLCGDTQILTLPFYGDFGSFKGDQPPDVEMLCSGADTAQYVDLLVLPQ